MNVNIGLEHERVIREVFDTNLLTYGSYRHVKGFPQESFPHDTMACLAETRGEPFWQAEVAVENFLKEQKRVDECYKKINMELIHGEHQIGQTLAEDCYENWDTKQEESEPDFNLIRGGGLHIHFSGNTRPRVLLNPFIIVQCVMALDKSLAQWITGKSSYRKPTQALAKPWGFEYRSCFWGGSETELMVIAKDAHKTVIETVNKILYPE